jgi:glucose-1-phosphate cytidylyltransferase
MKAVILAGGMGTRLSEETQKIPKPMVEIGGRPILWHIMKYYSSYGINDFIICCGYKGYLIKEYFYNYYMHNSDMTVNLGSGDVEFRARNIEKWKVTLVDTGVNTLTEGRLLCIKNLVEGETFCMTYGDGLCDVDIGKLVDFHHGCPNRIATVTAVKSQSRFGTLSLEDNLVSSFREKFTEDCSYINGGFFVLDPEIFNYMMPDQMFEQNTLVNIARVKGLYAYKHEGNWMCMDTLHDKGVLEDYWKSGEAFWKK